MTVMTMTQPISVAADPADTEAELVVRALIEVLEQENDALAAMRLEDAAALLPLKQSSADAISRIVRPVDLPADLMTRLRVAARMNQTLLERAMTVQGRVIALVAGPAASDAPRYGAGGAIAAARAVAPRAFIARA